MSGRRPGRLLVRTEGVHQAADGTVGAGTTLPQPSPDGTVGGPRATASGKGRAGTSHPDGTSEHRGLGPGAPSAHPPQFIPSTSGTTVPECQPAAGRPRPGA